MDTSKQYVKMCKEAKEIQKYITANCEKMKPLFLYDYLLDRMCVCFWVPKTMRQRLNQKQDEFIVSIEKDKDKNAFYEEGTQGKVIWLPRQDQLQEMLRDKFIYLQALFFGLWCEDNRFDDPKFTSMEQLWLAYVMYKKYKKFWKNEKWEAEDEISD